MPLVNTRRFFRSHEILVRERVVESRGKTVLEQKIERPAPLDLPAPASITHVHILAAINTRVAASGRTHFRICDMGCGSGLMLKYLATCLPALNPDCTFEFYGFDVADAGVQNTGFFARTIAMLSEAHPEIDWPSRLQCVTSKDAWPFDDESFDFVVSNQVLEHVADHRFVFGQIRRVLAPGGVAIHLFPVREVLFEGHVHMPFLHWFRTHSMMKAYIKACSRMGIGNYSYHKKRSNMPLEEYAERHADFMAFDTNYVTAGELQRYTKAARLRVDFSHTSAFYMAKLRSLMRSAPRYLYARPRPVWDALCLFFLKRMSCVTLVQEKPLSMGPIE